MEEEKRKILTKEKIRQNRLAMLRLEIILYGLCSVLIVAVWIGIVCWGYRDMPNGWYIWGTLALVCLALAAIPAWFAIKRIRWSYYIGSGRFYVVEDTLVAVGEDEVVRYRRRGGRGGHYTIDRLYFEKYGAIPEDEGVRGYGPCGSMFYLVVLDDKKQTLYTFYSSQLYYYDPKGA